MFKACLTSSTCVQLGILKLAGTEALLTRSLKCFCCQKSNQEILCTDPPLKNPLTPSCLAPSTGLRTMPVTPSKTPCEKLVIQIRIWGLDLKATACHFLKYHFQISIKKKSNIFSHIHIRNDYYIPVMVTAQNGSLFQHTPFSHGLVMTFFCSPPPLWWQRSPLHPTLSGHGLQSGSHDFVTLGGIIGPAASSQWWTLQGWLLRTQQVWGKRQS